MVKIIFKNKKHFTDDEKAVLWSKYYDGETDSLKNLAEAYIYLIEIVAAKLKAGLPQMIEAEELITDGYFGLVDAIEKFNNEKNHKFETYAVIRIRGAILDALRMNDTISRYHRGMVKEFTSAFDQLEDELERKPTVKELCDVLNWDEDKVLKVQHLYYTLVPIDLAELLSSEDEAAYAQPVFDNHGDLDFFIEEKDLAASLADALNTLSQQESLLIYERHFCGKNFQQISQEWGLGASRLSLIYAAAMEKLKEKILSF